MIRCLFDGPKKPEDSQGDSRVRGGFKVIPMRFMLQRQPSIRDPSHEKSNHRYKINTTSCCENTMTGGNHQIRKENFKTNFFGTDVESDLTANNSQ
jgi:hypothetical protein